MHVYGMDQMSGLYSVSPLYKEICKFPAISSFFTCSSPPLPREFNVFSIMSIKVLYISKKETIDMLIKCIQSNRIKSIVVPSTKYK